MICLRIILKLNIKIEEKKKFLKYMYDFISKTYNKIKLY